jgi:hypothetical protein
MTEANEVGLEKKYFVLKPRSKSYEDPYARASRKAMMAYADAIQDVNPVLAQDMTIL